MKLGVNKTFLFHENHHFIQNQPKPATFACDVELLTRRESQSRIQGGILLSLFALFTSVWIQGEPGQERGVYPEIRGIVRGPKFTWLNASFAMKRQAVRLRPGPQNNFEDKIFCVNTS